MSLLFRPAETVSDWSLIAENQRIALLRRGGIINFAARLKFIPLWGLLCYLLARHLGTDWLLLPAAASLLFALGLFQRYRLIQDTPRSSLGSSAQGYVELCGQARLPDGEGFRGLSNLPVTVWLPGYIEDQPFVLDDGQGQCLLYPQAAEIITRPANTHLDWLHAIYPGQTLYVLGDLRTDTASSLNFSRSQRISERLARWKSRPAELLQAYDHNQNGRLDAEEWEQVRATASRLADEEIHDEDLKGGTHLIDRSTGGRLFLITNIPPEELALRYRLAGWLHTLGWLGLMAAVHLCC